MKSLKEYHEECEEQFEVEKGMLKQLYGLIAWITVSVRLKSGKWYGGRTLGWSRKTRDFAKMIEQYPVLTKRP